MSPSPNQTHLLCWRWSSGFRGNKSVVGFIRPLGKAPRVGKHGSWLPHGCHLPSQFGVSIDSGTHPFFPRGQHSLRSVKGGPLPSPSTPPRPPSSWIRHSQPSMPRGRTGQRCGVATDCSLSADRQPESGTRPTTHRDRRRFSQPGGLPFAVGESRGLVRMARPGPLPTETQRARVRVRAVAPFSPLSSLESRRLRSQCGAPCRILPPPSLCSWLLSRGSVPPTKKKC